MDWDRYAYVRNCPTKNNDPTGHKACTATIDGGCDPFEEEVVDFLDEIEVVIVTSLQDSNRDGGDAFISEFIMSLPGNAYDYSLASKTIDTTAAIIDIFAAGVVTYGGIAGAGIGLPFALGGPEVPVVTGLAGVGIAELAVQPLLKASSVLSFVSAGATYISDTKEGITIIEKGVISSSTANSLTIAIAGAVIPEAYINMGLSIVAVTNDFGITSFPWPNFH